MAALEKLVYKIKHQLSSHSIEMTYIFRQPSGWADWTRECNCRKSRYESLFIGKFGGNVLFSYPTDRSKLSLVFMGNIALDEVIEHVRNINSTNCSVKIAKQLRKEILWTESIPSGNLCDEALIIKKGQLPKTWQKIKW